MPDDNPAQRSFFDTDLPSAPLSAPSQAPVLNVAAPQTQTVAPIALFAPSKKKRKADKVKRAPKPAELSTWLVGTPLLAIAAIGVPTNPALSALAVGGALVLTAAYTAALGRPSWARLRARRSAVGPALAGLALITAAAYLPSALFIAPTFMTAPPTPTAEQSTALINGMSGVDSRFADSASSDRFLSIADAICINDFSAQTPERAVTDIQESFTFVSEPALTAGQARSILNLVRDTYCGQPGEREEAVQSELVYTLPGLWSVATNLIPEKETTEPVS